MSRKITEMAAAAFVNAKDFKEANTEVVVSSHTSVGYETRMVLHGNTIAKGESVLGLKLHNLRITTAGWDTFTTRERLNGLPGVRVYHRKGELYLNGNKWDGEWIEVK